MLKSLPCNQPIQESKWAGVSCDTSNFNPWLAKPAKSYTPNQCVHFPLQLHNLQLGMTTYFLSRKNFFFKASYQYQNVSLKDYHRKLSSKVLKTKVPECKLSYGSVDPSEPKERLTWVQTRPLRFMGILYKQVQLVFLWEGRKERAFSSWIRYHKTEP